VQTRGHQEYPLTYNSINFYQSKKYFKKNCTKDFECTFLSQHNFSVTLMFFETIRPKTGTFLTGWTLPPFGCMLFKRKHSKFAKAPELLSVTLTYCHFISYWKLFPQKV
jgi:hypothetical protein